MHTLRSLEALSLETGIDALWLKGEADAGRLPSLRLPSRDGMTVLYFDLNAVARLIALRAGSASEPISKQSEANKHA